MLAGSRSRALGGRSDGSSSARQQGESTFGIWGWKEELTVGARQEREAVRDCVRRVARRAMGPGSCWGHQVRVCRTARGAGGSDAGFVFKLFQTVSSGKAGTETEKRPAEEIQYVCVWSYTYIRIYKICTYK